MSDEHRADVAGYEGNPIIRTPVLDELARTGVVFRNAYTPSPVCIPGRQSIMAGRFPRNCGCEHFGEDLPPGAMTFARQFSRHAYQTVACGKLHHTGPDQMQGWLRRYGADIHVHPKHVDGRDEAAFQSYAPSPMKGKRSLKVELIKSGVGRGRLTHDADRMALDGAMTFAGHHFLDPYFDRCDPSQPVLLKLSFNRPHYPFYTTEEKFTYYLNRVRPFGDQEPFDHPYLARRHMRPGEDVSERDMRRATAAYYGMIEEVDDDFGRLLEHLRHAGQNLDDWIIVYTSDHGEMLGEHGIWEKKQFFEGSARVPLIIRWPQKFAPRVVGENVSLCDLFATLCELAGLPVPAGLDSRSLVPLMRGDAGRWDNEAVSQYQGKNLMIKRGNLKYQSYGADIPEVLFDLSKDPGECRNFIGEPDYADELDAFRRRRAELGF